MPDVALCECVNRAQADLVLAILADEGIHGVAFDDVERGDHGQVARERSVVRVLAEDLERARKALDEWTSARREGVDPDELERQALEAGEGAGAEAPLGGTRDANAPEDPDDRSPDPRGDREARDATDACPHCGAAAPVRGLARVLRAFGGRGGRARGERLCTACGHRWT